MTDDILFYNNNSNKKYNYYYLDNAATTQMDIDVLNGLYYDYCYNAVGFGNPSSLHFVGTHARQTINNHIGMLCEDYNKIIKNNNENNKELMLNKTNFIFTSGGSESNNLAIKGIAKYLFKTKNKNHIITSQIEHPSILNACKQLETEGFEVTYLSCDKKGKINLDELKDSIKDNTALVSIMYVNNETGTENDIKSIFKMCVDNNVYFHTDAVQSTNAPLFSVLPLYCHSFSLSGHKFGAMQGVGLLYISNDLKLEPQIVGGHQQNGLRAGTENILGICSIIRALCFKNLNKDLNLSKLNDNTRLECELETLVNYINQTNVNDYIITTPKECFHNGILNISFNNVEGESLVLAMNKEYIYISSGSACSAGSIEPSYVLTSMGYSDSVAKNAIRISLKRSYLYTDEQLKEIANTLVKCVNNIRRINGD